jgi:L-threonylcarbamoyladenylate synthase
LALIRAAGSPLAAPSANLFGRTSPTTAAHVRGEFGSDVFVLDGGASDVGLESTVAGFTASADGSHDVVVYRPGAVTADMIRGVLKREGVSGSVSALESNVAPGHLEHHYMPKIPLIIVAEGSDLSALGVRPVKMVLSKDPVIAARELYAKMREIAESGASEIIIEKPKAIASHDLWVAIWNRLEKAASQRLN